jgi:transposase
MLTMTNVSVTREHVWTAFRRRADGRLRERSHAIVLLMDGKSCPEVAPWLSRDEDTIRAWGHALNEAGLRGLERATIPGRPT